MLIYFAGPLFSAAEKKFNLEVTQKLEEVGFEVFLPQRDGAESSKPPYNVMTKDERRKVMFRLDQHKIMEADIFLIVFDGRVPDEGACVELGMAFMDKFHHNREKKLIGLQTDIRYAFSQSQLNPMLSVPLDFLAKSEDELVKYLTKNSVEVK